MSHDLERKIGVAVPTVTGEVVVTVAVVDTAAEGVADRVAEDSEDIRLDSY